MFSRNTITLALAMSLLGGCTGGLPDEAGSNADVATTVAHGPSATVVPVQAGGPRCTTEDLPRAIDRAQGAPPEVDPHHRAAAARVAPPATGPVPAGAELPPAGPEAAERLRTYLTAAEQLAREHRGSATALAAARERLKLRLVDEPLELSASAERARAGATDEALFERLRRSR